jgi:hypothetical protein
VILEDALGVHCGTLAQPRISIPVPPSGVKCGDAQGSRNGMAATSDDSPITTFRVLAERYCAFIESSESLGRGEFVWQLAEHLVGLYAAGMRLPFPDGDDDFDAPESMTSEEYQELFQRLGRKLGDADFYSVMFDPYESGSTPVTGSLADDAADIYRDLLSGLNVIAVEGGLGNAVWEWRFGFDNHWGKHAAEALYALHSLTHPGSVKWVARHE